MKTILIDIDSLRPDHMGCYGHSKDITPNIDSLADDSTVFTQAYAAATPSLPSRAVIFSGRYPESNKVVTHGAEAQQMNSPYFWSHEKLDNWDGSLKQWWNLPELFFQNGINCCAVSSFGRYPVPWMFRTWHEYIQPESDKENGTHAMVDGVEVKNQSLNWLENNLEDDFFFYIQFWDPHVPCLREKSEIEDINDQLPSYLQNVGFNGQGYRSAEEADVESREDLRELIKQYEAEIKHVDKQIGKIIDYLKEKEIYEQTSIILTSDHGEEFGEHGVFREHWSAFNGTQKIPLIMKTPDNQKDRINEKISNIDLAPTIADIHGLEKPEKWQGRSILKRIDNSEWDNQILTMHGLYTVQRAVIGDKYKLVETLHSGIRPELDEIQLFDIEKDPHEQVNILDEKRGVAQRLMSYKENEIEKRIIDEDPVKKLASEGPYGWKWNN